MTHDRRKCYNTGKVPEKEELCTNPIILPVFILYMILINVLSLLLVRIRSRKAPEESVNPLLCVFVSLIGGGIGVLLALVLSEQRPKAALFIPAVILSVLWGLIPAALSSVPAIQNSLFPARIAAAETVAVVPEETSMEPETTEASVPEKLFRREPDSIVDESDERSPEEISRSEAEQASLEEAKRQESAAEEAESTEEDGPAKLTIIAVGDMLMHPGVSGLAFQADGTLNYDFCFDPIREELSAADIAVVNNEVPFGGNEYGLSNYPNFNVYCELGDAEVRAGFNVILNATNHVRDMGTEGMLRTIEFWKKYPEVYSLGIHENEESQRTIRVIVKNGIRIALLNYCYGINAGFPYDQPYLVDMMRNEDRERIARDLQLAEEFADFTIVFPHWGEEYHLRETGDQDRWAELFTEYGADLIIGTHPHVLEPIRKITAENGNTSLCYFSLGNYISLQDETMSVLGGMAKVRLIADDDGVRIDSHDIQYLVTQYEADVSWARVIRLEDYTQDLAQRHGIRTAGLPGNGLNAAYPFSIDTFYRIIGEVNQYSDAD